MSEGGGVPFSLCDHYINEKALKCKPSAEFGGNIGNIWIENTFACICIR